MRFYIPKIDKSNLKLTDEAHAHANVLRIKCGDYLSVFDGSGEECYCRVKQITPRETTLELLDVKADEKETNIDITLFLSVIKQDRFEFAVQKATELGVKRIVPVYSMFAQRNIKLNLDRFERIAISACEQCGRSLLPAIEQPIEFDELVSRASTTHIIFPWEREFTNTMADAIDKTKKDVSVFIGPEGGITESERDTLIKAGAVSVTLGKRILRAETAAIAALSVVMYEMGEWTY